MKRVISIRHEWYRFCKGINITLEYSSLKIIISDSFLVRLAPDKGVDTAIYPPNQLVPGTPCNSVHSPRSTRRLDSVRINVSRLRILRLASGTPLLLPSILRLRAAAHYDLLKLSLKRHRRGFLSLRFRSQLSRFWNETVLLDSLWTAMFIKSSNNSGVVSSVHFPLHRIVSAPKPQLNSHNLLHYGMGTLSQTPNRPPPSPHKHPSPPPPSAHSSPTSPPPSPSFIWWKQSKHLRSLFFVEISGFGVELHSLHGEVGRVFDPIALLNLTFFSMSSHG
ncbi:hypothetical protein LOK49_LG08G00088 [Camellia lanceoleosa]|uniref:Uncharacterized protein n=1 Tax=Camellia lanceoleosa TaxID=1840588 RepID=A0ACC0GNL0_9ERIC|nr:hypothetical protein LOK49_LG08G00088 [Camellia lanceoleosa]